MTTPSYRNTVALTLIRTLYRSIQRLETNGAEIIAESGLSTSEFDAVMALGNREHLRMGELAASMLTSAPNVTRVLKILENKGLAERFRNPQSDRETLARLTPQGVAIFESFYPRIYAHQKALLDARLSEKDQQQVAQILQKFL